MQSRLVHRADAIDNLSAKGRLCIVPGTRIYRGSVSCQEYDRFRIPARHRPQSPARVAASPKVDTVRWYPEDLLAMGKILRRSVS